MYLDPSWISATRSIGRVVSSASPDADEAVLDLLAHAPALFGPLAQLLGVLLMLVPALDDELLRGTGPGACGSAAASE